MFVYALIFSVSYWIIGFSACFHTWFFSENLVECFNCMLTIDLSVVWLNDWFLTLLSHMFQLYVEVCFLTESDWFIGFQHYPSLQWNMMWHLCLVFAVSLDELLLYHPACRHFIYLCLFIWFGCRVCEPPEPFLLVLYSPLHSRPEFYECTTRTGKAELDYSLYSACDRLQLPTVSIMEQFDADKSAVLSSVRKSMYW